MVSSWRKEGGSDVKVTRWKLKQIDAKPYIIIITHHLIFDGYMYVVATTVASS